MTIAVVVLACDAAFCAGFLVRGLFGFERRPRRGGDVDLVGARPRSVRTFDRVWDLPRIESDVSRDRSGVESGRVVPLAPFRRARGGDE